MPMSSTRNGARPSDARQFIEPCLRADRSLQQSIPCLWFVVKCLTCWGFGLLCMWTATKVATPLSPPSPQTTQHSHIYSQTYRNGASSLFNGLLRSRITENQQQQQQQLVVPAAITIVTELSTYNSSSNDLKNLATELGIQSWLENAHHVVVLVEDEALCGNVHSKFPSPALLCVLHHCNHPDFLIPTVPCLMVTGEAHAPTQYVLFSNSDIIYGPLEPTLNKVVQQLQNFVLTGQRTDIQAHKFESSRPKNTQDILKLAIEEGENHGESAIDYFLYPKTLSLARKMPPFLLGNWRWDNWLLHELIVANHIKVIDATTDILAIHIGSTATALVHRPGAVHNSRVFESSTFGLQGIGMGTFRYADAKLDKGRIVYNTDFEIAQTKFIFSNAMSSETLIVVTVPCGFLGMLKNWLMWVERSHIKSFIIFAMDITTLDYAQSEQLPVASMTSQPIPDLATCRKMSQKQLETLLMDRNAFLKNISSTGLGFVSMTVNTVLLEPFKYSYLRSRDLFGQKMTGPNRTSLISDGFWGASPMFSKNAVKLLANIISCQKSKLDTMNNDELPLIVAGQQACQRLQLDSVATQCLNAEIKKSYSGGLSFLADSFVSSGSASFLNHNPLRLGIYPGIVHQDLVCNYHDSVGVLMKWNMWAGQENFQKVLPYSKPLEIVPITSPTVASIALRILTMNRPESLLALLASLQNATYDNNDLVDIEFHIDYPKNSSVVELAVYAEVQLIIKLFKWSHGEKRVIDPGTHRGLFGMWVQPFTPRVPGQVLMVLEDDNELSPVYFAWCKTLLQHLDLYRDPKLYGFTLQRQHSVIALKPDQKYPMTFIDLKMDQSKPFYRYQLLSSWGTLLFPAQWNNFVDWAVTTKRKSPNFDPCIPYFFNNIWYTKRPDHIWTIWFNYYIYMHGMYSLYVNYARYDEEVIGNQVDTDNRIFFSLLKNHRAQGLHFDGSKAKKKTKKVDMQDKLEFLIEPPPKMLLPPTSYPLFDFHLQYVPNSVVLNNRWRFASGLTGKDKCVANHDENGRTFSVKKMSSATHPHHGHGHKKTHHSIKSMEQN